MPATTHILSSGHLSVSHGHELYYEEWGNPQGVPIIHLHGGPGANFSDTHKAIYDPQRHRVLFHDQRGAGRSRPSGELGHNTTQDLISDINVLREHLNFPTSAVVAGGSWGSTLALLYAISHPDRVMRLFIWSVYLGTQFEADWVYQGHLKHHLPTEWQAFEAAARLKPNAATAEVVAAYDSVINGPNKKAAEQAAQAWMRWEASLMSVEYSPEAVDQDIATDPGILASARIQLHYFKQHCFIPDNYIMTHLEAIQHLPTHITHGRFDLCTPASSAAKLAAGLPKSTIQFVNSGHRRTDPAMFAALQAKAQGLRI